MPKIKISPGPAPILSNVEEPAYVVEPFITPAEPSTSPVGMPPSWYPDPINPGLLQYWDGMRWTEHRQATTPAVSVVQNNVHSGGGGEIAIHIILTLITCGAWLPIWLLIEIVKLIFRR